MGEKRAISVKKGTLYLLFFMITNHINTKIPKHMFGNFPGEDPYDFEIYKIWI